MHTHTHEDTLETHGHGKKLLIHQDFIFQGWITDEIIFLYVNLYVTFYFV